MSRAIIVDDVDSLWGTCEYCGIGEDDGICEGEKGDVLCTRIVNHDGPHVACGLHPRHAEVTWE